MISPAKVDEIARLLKTGLSQRKTAAAAEVSRATVRGVADGTRPDYERPRRERVVIDKGYNTGPIARCPTCGQKCHMPCHLCHVRRFKAAEKGAHKAAAHGARHNQASCPTARLAA